jgi:hypothetical protein
MSYQSLNPATGKLLKKFVELTDKELETSGLPQGDETLIARHIATRHEHFMPPSLLHSQFEALETRPGRRSRRPSRSRRNREIRASCQR